MRTGVSVSAFRNSVIHKIFSELLQPFRYVGMARVSPFLIVVFVFIWFWFFGWLGQQLLFRDFRRARVSPSCLSTCLLDTPAGKGSIPHGSPRSCLATLSLDTVEDVMDGEADELEEDVG